LNTADDTGAKKAGRHNLRLKCVTKYLPVIVVLAAGIILAALTFKIMEGYENNKIQLELQRSAENRMMSLQRSLEAGYLVLESMAAFHNSTAEMKRQDFNGFVQPLLKSNIAIQALEWIPRVTLAQRPVYEQAARLDGYEQFSITQRKTQGQMVGAEEREEYYPVYYVEPYQGNEIALGFDLASSPIRKQALESSRDSGQMTASARITLVQERGTQCGFLIYLPVYLKDSSGVGRQDRRSHLKGFMLGVFRIGDLVEKAVSYLDPQGVDILIDDMSAPEEERLLYFHPSGEGSKPMLANALEAPERTAQFAYSALIDVAGRRWRTTCIASPVFIAAKKTFIPLTISVAIVLCSVFAAAYLSSTLCGKSRLKQTLALLQNKMEACRRVEKALCESEERLGQAQKMEAIGTLAGGIAHDFNNILAAITGYCELAMARGEEGNGQHADLLQILKAADRAAALVKQILTFSRKHKEELKPIQISPIVKEVINLLKATLPATIEIHADIRNHPDSILADPTFIHQVIMNLCTNAAHAMQDTGGRLEVGLRSVEAEALLTSGSSDPSSGPWLKLSVKDTGHGMTPEIMGSIFDPYFTTKAPGEGTGLGLSVVHGIVKKCGGEIRVESEMGKGSTFNVFWPQIKMAPQLQPECVKPSITGNESILIVDDEPALTAIAQRKLTQLGYRVTTRTSSIEAKALFKVRPDDFNLVITDMNMPHMTGLQLARQMLVIRPGMPIILCTGFSQQISEENAKTMGIKEFMLKPISWQELAEIVRKVLDGNSRGMKN
jgi:signal transduction histidine kinase/ActR/RegA family two-component response regulator/sensor domain CHASE-containing protein